VPKHHLRLKDPEGPVSNEERELREFWGAFGLAELLTDLSYEVPELRRYFPTTAGAGTSEIIPADLPPASDS
jgi:hypothetical protein